MAERGHEIHKKAKICPPPQSNRCIRGGFAPEIRDFSHRVIGRPVLTNQEENGHNDNFVVVGIPHKTLGLNSSSPSSVVFEIELVMGR